MKFNPAKPFPCVYLKHGAYWYVKRGKWERIGSNLEEACAEYAKRQQQAKEGRFPKMIDTALAQHLAAKKLADNTANQYKLAAEVLKRRFRSFDSPAQIKPRHVAQLKAEGAKTPNMTNRVVSLLRSLFTYWLEAGQAEMNPCVGIKRHAEGKRKRLIEHTEWWAIYDKAGPRLRAIMKVAYLTGQRIGDVLSIRRSQLTEAGIQFRQQKTGKQVLIKWSPDLLSARDEALALHGRVPGLTLFPGMKGKPPNYRSVHKQWTEACKAAGVEDARPNDQRAQSLTAANKEGKDATALAGHSTKAMTARYLRDRSAVEVEGPILRQSLDVGQKS